LWNMWKTSWGTWGEYIGNTHKMWWEHQIPKNEIKIQPQLFFILFVISFEVACAIFNSPHPFHLYGHLGVQIILFYFPPSSLPLWPLKVQAWILSSLPWGFSWFLDPIVFHYGPSKNLTFSFRLLFIPSWVPMQYLFSPILSTFMAI
jgi:hypothetical protein